MLAGREGERALLELQPLAGGHAVVDDSLASRRVNSKPFHPVHPQQ